MSNAADLDFVALMPQVARRLWGEPTLAHSNGRELRWGNHGARKVDVAKGVWHDHETGEGGGVLDLLRREGIADQLAWLRQNGFVAAKDDGNTRRKRKIIATYDYLGKDGALAFQVVRFEPKGFAQRRKARPDDPADKIKRDGWVWNLDGVRRPLYRLPALGVAIDLGYPIFVVEGEKDVLALERHRIVATTNPGGVGKWRTDYADDLAGADVVAIPDNDMAGRDHALSVCRSLAGKARRVRLLALPGLPEKGDVSDWLALPGNTVAQLRALADKAPDWINQEPTPMNDGNKDTFQEQPAAEAPRARIRATPFVWRDLKQIPQRQWLFARHYIRDHVTCTIATSGGGKTATQTVDALAMTTGHNLTGDAPKEPLRVWLWNGEEPLEEMERRLRAACLHYNIDDADIGGRLFLNSGRDTDIIIAHQTRNGTIIAQPVVDDLIATIRENHIDVVMIDPFVASHRVTENDNNAIETVVKQGWVKIVHNTHCNAELSHHIRKIGNAEITVDDSRGAGALIAAARSIRIINRMTETEAGNAGVDNHFQYFRIAIGKANMMLPSAKATWRRLESVDLCNDAHGGPGDNVGVATAWSWPDAFANVTVRDLHRAQQAVDQGKWRENAQAKDWVGIPIAKALNLDIGSGKLEQRSHAQRAAVTKVKTLLDTWTRNNAFTVVESEDKNRNKRSFVEVGEWCDPDTITKAA